MPSNTDKTTQEEREDIDIRQAEVLIESLREANKTFAEKYDAQAREIENITERANAETKKLLEDLSDFEKEKMQEIDTLIEGFVGEKGE